MENLKLQKKIEKILLVLKTKKVNSIEYKKYSKRLAKKFEQLHKVRRTRYNSISVEQMFSISKQSNLDIKFSMREQFKNLKNR